MQEAFLASPKRDDSWDDSLGMSFEKNEDGLWIGKTNKKAAYNNEATKPPGQYDAKNKPLDDKFMLTTGSKGTLLVKFIPYKMSAKNMGVSLQLQAVQVLEYKPLMRKRVLRRIQLPMPRIYNLLLLGLKMKLNRLNRWFKIVFLMTMMRKKLKSQLSARKRKKKNRLRLKTLQILLISGEMIKPYELWLYDTYR